MIEDNYPKSLHDAKHKGIHVDACLWCRLQVEDMEAEYKGECEC